MKKPVKKRKVAVSGKKPSDKKWTKVEWVCIGADVSMSSISLAGLARTRDGKLRHGAISKRWLKNTDYFIRLKEAAAAQEFTFDLFAEMKVMAELNEIAFAVEEAVSIGFLQRAESAWVKQQLQISGAFLGGLLKWGYSDIYEIQANQWRALVAHDLGITTHTSKWNNTEYLALPPEFHAAPKNVGKYRAQQWVQVFHSKWDGHWPDIVNTKDGQVPRGNSKAQGVQSDDRYEALAMAEWLRRELKKSN